MSDRTMMVGCDRIHRVNGFTYISHGSRVSARLVARITVSVVQNVSLLSMRNKPSSSFLLATMEHVGIFPTKKRNSVSIPENHTRSDSRCRKQKSSCSMISCWVDSNSIPLKSMIRYY